MYWLVKRARFWLAPRPNPSTGAFFLCSMPGFFRPSSTSWPNSEPSTPNKTIAVAWRRFNSVERLGLRKATSKRQKIQSWFIKTANLILSKENHNLHHHLLLHDLLPALVQPLIWQVKNYQPHSVRYHLRKRPPPSQNVLGSWLTISSLCC